MVLGELQEGDRSCDHETAARSDGLEVFIAVAHRH